MSWFSKAARADRKMWRDYEYATGQRKSFWWGMAVLAGMVLWVVGAAIVLVFVFGGLEAVF